MRARTNLATKEKRSFRISDFRGVDFSTSPLHVQANRAIDMTNWSCENGTNKKRPGWAQVTETLTGRINGIFPYRDADGKTELLVHAGEGLWRVYETNGAYRKAAVGLPADTSITNERSQAFYQGGDLYLTCGSGCYLRYETKQKPKEGYAAQATLVEPYIPTTTISIDEIAVKDTVRKSLDSVNLLTKQRKNKLVGAPERILIEATDTEEAVKGGRWFLDGQIEENTDVTIELKLGSSLSVEERILKNKNGSIYFYNDNETRVGYYFNYKDSNQCIINLYMDTTPPVEGESNITVIFTAKADNRATRIENCRFGTLFGVGGNEDRLFLSGNPDYPNVVFFSESNDFTYFPDTFTATLGTDQSAVTGFLRLADNTLATFKAYTERESTVYYQSGEYRSFYDDEGNLKKIEPVFRITAGATGESAVNPYVSANLAGDNVTLSQNGVFAIEPTSNVLTDTRTARERGYAIRERLIRQESIKDAAGVVYKGKYYLSVDGVCYVADSRYKYQPADSLSYSYEWWYWDNIPARVWAVVDGALWFGTADGRICRFDERYTDRTFEVTSDGDLGLENGKIDYNGTVWNPQENDVFQLRTDGGYARYAQITESSGVLRTDDMANVYEGDEVCFLKADGQADTARYTVTDVNRVAGTFALMKDGELASDVKGDTLLLPLSGRNLYITDVEEVESRFSLKLTADGKALDIVLLGNNSIGEFYRSENVVARWCTPYFDMGSNESAKTLLKLTVSQLPGMGGKMKFGYETDKRLCEIDAKGTGIFSFEELDFDDFSFTTGFQNSYSVKVKERNFNYILFRFVSDSDKVCSINDLTAIYKINKRNLGVM